MKGYFSTYFQFRFTDSEIQNFFLENFQFEAIYHILSSIVRTFFKEGYAEILPVHYAWKVPEKGFKINWVMH